MKLEGKKIIVVGLGRSGVAAADLCARLGAMVTGTDRMSADYASKQVLELAENGIEVALGGHEGVAWTEADMVVVSPGVPQFSGLVEAERAGAEVIGELELASRLVRAPIGVIGGTNGKSTVTSWVGQMLSGPGRKVFVGGNLGTPLAEQALDTFDHVILEVSSFQAERIQQLRPRAAALLNITDDHLDRYESFDAYAHTKGNVFVNMGSDDTAIVPAGDELCAKQANRGGARQATFGSGGDVSIVGNEIVDRIHGWT
ncbi:MAG: UDP-N-acetylmuramoylalanine--D-glutamate ligase, partial [Sorangium cellulosum]